MRQAKFQSIVEQTPVTPNPATGLVLRIIVELLVTPVTAFGLAAFAAPILMDIRNNLAFWAGAACWPLAALVVAVGLAWIVRDLKELFRLRNGPTRISGPD